MKTAIRSLMFAIVAGSVSPVWAEDFLRGQDCPTQGVVATVISVNVGAMTAEMKDGEARRATVPIYISEQERDLFTVVVSSMVTLEPLIVGGTLEDPLWFAKKGPADIVTCWAEGDGVLAKAREAEKAATKPPVLAASPALPAPPAVEASPPAKSAAVTEEKIPAPKGYRLPKRAPMPPDRNAPPLAEKKKPKPRPQGLVPPKLPGALPQNPAPTVVGLRR